MDTVGIKREIDKFGRVCIPKEIRSALGLDKEVELIITKDGLLIKSSEYVLMRKNGINALVSNEPNS